MRSASLRRLVRDTYAKWNADDGWLYAAAMAAFAALALGPLLVITLRVSEALGSDRPVLHGLALVIDPIVGHGGVRAIAHVAGNSRRPTDAALTTAVAVLIALFAGSRLFYALQRALHKMWRTEERRGTSVATTVVSFFAAAILSVCFIGVLALVIFGTAALSAAAHDAHAGALLSSLGVRAGIAILGGLLLLPVVAALFRWLPGTDLTWADVWIGAATTTAGFAVAQLVIGFYLAHVNLTWTYGSAASLVVILLWLYYSSYLFLLGAEFTQVYAEVRRRRP